MVVGRPCFFVVWLRPCVFLAFAFTWLRAGLVFLLCGCVVAWLWLWPCAFLAFAFTWLRADLVLPLFVSERLGHKVTYRPLNFGITRNEGVIPTS